MATANSSPLPHTLALIANGSDHILTTELARIVRRATQTIRKAYSQTGSFLGLVPVKIGNRLHWPVQDVATLLAKGSR